MQMVSDRFEWGRVGWGGMWMGWDVDGWDKVGTVGCCMALQRPQINTALHGCGRMVDARRLHGFESSAAHVWSFHTSLLRLQKGRARPCR